jgi:hypothetical protein
MVDIQVVRGKVSGWMSGVVTSISADLLSIKFVDSPPEYDKMIDRWSTRVAQAGKKTSADYEWRRKNLLGATDYLIDCYDGTDWLEATI